MASMTKDTLFKATETGRSNKADATTAASRAIIDAEVSAREKKTERLRKLRMEQESQASPEGEAPPRKTPARTAAPKKPAARRATSQKAR